MAYAEQYVMAIPLTDVRMDAVRATMFLVKTAATALVSLIHKNLHTAQYKHKRTRALDGKYLL